MIWNHYLRCLVVFTLFLACLGIIPTEPGNVYSAETPATEKVEDEQPVNTELNALIKEMNRHYKKKRYRVALELGKELLREIENAAAVDWEKLADVYFGIAFSYYALGDYTGMDSYFEKTIEFIRQTAEKEGEEYCTCDGLKMVADLYRKMKLYDRAEKMYLESMHETEKVRGPAHKSLIPQLDALVEINLARLNYPAAKKHLERSVRLTEQGLGSGHANTKEKKEKLNALSRVLQQEAGRSNQLATSPQSPTIFVQTGHTDNIASVAFSLDGKYAVTAGWDAMVKLWEVSSGRVIRTFKGHKLAVVTAHFVPGGKYILSGSIDKTLRLWDLATGREVRRLFGHHEDITSIAVSSDGGKALSGGNDKVVILWDLTTGEKLQTFQGHKKGVTQVGFMADDRHIYSVGKQLIIWDRPTGQKIKTRPSPGRIYASGRRFLKFRKQAVDIGDLSSGELLKTLELKTGAWKGSLRINSDGTQLLYIKDKRLHVLDTTTGETRSHLENIVPFSVAVAFSPDNRHLLLGGDKLVLFDLETSRTRWSVGGTASLRLMRITVDKDETRAFILSSSGYGIGKPTLTVWELTNGNRVTSRKVAADDVRGIAISNDCQTYSAAFNGRVHIKDMWTKKFIKILPEFPGKVIRMFMSPDKRYLVTVSRKTISTRKIVPKKPKLDGRSTKKPAKKRRKKKKKKSSRDEYYTIVWNIAAAKQIFSVKQTRRIMFSADTSFFIVNTKNGFETRSLDGGGVLETYSGIPGGARTITLSPDFRLLACTSRDDKAKKRKHSLTLWDLHTKKLLKTIVLSRVKGRPVFTADNNFLLLFSGKNDLTLQMLDLTTLEIIKRLHMDEKFYTIAHWNPDDLDRVLFKYNRSYNRFDALFGDLDSIAAVDIRSGKTTHVFEGHDGSIMDAEALRASERILSVSYDKTIRLWDAKTGKEICRFYSFADGEWLVMTPAGFFNASKNGAKYINVAIGMQVYSIDQFHDILYRPDLIEARLQGDPEGLFAKALEKHDLAAILSRGAAPQVTYLSHRPGQVDKRDVNLEVKLTDRGGGEGRTSHRGEPGGRKIRTGAGAPVDQTPDTVNRD